MVSKEKKVEVEEDQKLGNGKFHTPHRDIRTLVFINLGTSVFPFQNIGVKFMERQVKNWAQNIVFHGATRPQRP
jgi:hypothetical protein